MENDFYPEAIVAWRAWQIRLVGRKLYLVSLNHRSVWAPNEWLEASCRKGKHETPGARCTCGIYAVKDFTHLQNVRVLPTARVFGEVWLAGEIVEGTAGYRAARAYPKHLYVSYTSPELAAPLQAFYDVPVGLKNPYEGATWRKHEYRQRKA